MSDDRERKSWKEIDRMRDSSQRREPRGDRPPGGPRQQKSYRAALDRAFASGAVGQLVKEKDGESGEVVDEVKAELQRAILEAEDRPTITMSIDVYLEKYEVLPSDPDVLAKAVQHKNPGLQLDAMELLDKILDERKPRRIRALIGHLKLLRDMADDREMEELASRLIDRLD